MAASEKLGGAVVPPVRVPGIGAVFGCLFGLGGGEFVCVGGCCVGVRIVLYWVGLGWAGGMCVCVFGCRELALCLGVCVGGSTHPPIFPPTKHTHTTTNPPPPPQKKTHTHKQTKKILPEGRPHDLLARLPRHAQAEFLRLALVVLVRLPVVGRWLCVVCVCVCVWLCVLCVCVFILWGCGVSVR
jgi:hypothetical protein